MRNQARAQSQRCRNVAVCRGVAGLPGGTRSLVPDVIIPVLDEAVAVPALFARVPEDYRPAVVDDGSTDGSGEIAAGGVGGSGRRTTRRNRGCGAPGRATGWAGVFHGRRRVARPRRSPAVSLAGAVLTGDADLVLAARRPTPTDTWQVHVGRPTWRSPGRCAGASGGRCATSALWVLSGVLACVHWGCRTAAAVGRSRWCCVPPMHDGGSMRSRCRTRDVLRVGRSKVTGTVDGTERAVTDVRAVRGRVRPAATGTP